VPNPRRKEIDYTPQFGGGIFRPKEVVEEERTALAGPDEQAPEERSLTPLTEQAAPPAVESEGTPPPSTAADAQRARKPSSKHASTLASQPDSYLPEAVATIRKVVKAPGREVSFVRLSPQEKGQLADIVYTYKRQGQKTSENEINRIALNFLLADYHAHGEQSMLARVLAALQA
jgi:hypothetical protein